MKISLKLANGAMLEFEGDEAEFERMQEFLAAPPDSLTAPAPARGLAMPQRTSLDDVGVPGETDSEMPLLDTGAVAERLQAVGARNDQERVTVMAQIATEDGREGIDFPTVIELYTELGFPKPAQFPSKTFSNAKASGLVRPIKPGVWRPTHRGENFARGFGRGPERPARRSAARGKGSTSGGDSD